MSELVDQAYAIWQQRRDAFERLGYTPRHASQLALEGADPEDVKTELAALLRKGCPPETARAIVR